MVLCLVSGKKNNPSNKPIIKSCLIKLLEPHFLKVNNDCMLPRCAQPYSQATYSSRLQLRSNSQKQQKKWVLFISAFSRELQRKGGVGRPLEVVAAGEGWCCCNVFTQCYCFSFTAFLPQSPAAGSLSVTYHTQIIAASQILSSRNPTTSCMMQDGVPNVLFPFEFNVLVQFSLLLLLLLLKIIT